MATAIIIAGGLEAEWVRIFLSSLLTYMISQL